MIPYQQIYIVIVMEIFLSIVAALTVLRSTFKWFFDSMDDMLESLMFWVTPDVIDMMRGRFQESLWAELKVWVWVGMSVIVGFAVHAFLVA